MVEAVTERRTGQSRGREVAADRPVKRQRGGQERKRLVGYFSTETKTPTRNTPRVVVYQVRDCTTRHPWRATALIEAALLNPKVVDRRDDQICGMDSQNIRTSVSRRQNL